MGDSEDTQPFQPGDRIRITAGTFEGFQAEVTAVDPAANRISAGIQRLRPGDAR